MVLRDLLGAHRIAIFWLFELFEGDDVFLRFMNTKKQVLGIFVAEFNSGEAWSPLMDLCSLFPSGAGRRKGKYT